MYLASVSRNTRIQSFSGTRLTTYLSMKQLPQNKTKQKKNQPNKQTKKPLKTPSHTNLRKWSYNTLIPAVYKGRGRYLGLGRAGAYAEA